MRYYSVEALCGHDGKGRCIRKNFGVTAENGKEAAKKGRLIPRVKHDARKAILSVEEISYYEFLALISKNKTDPYLMAKNIQEQRMACLELKIEYMEDYQNINQYRKGRPKVSKKAYENRYKPHDGVIIERYLWR